MSDKLQLEVVLAAIDRATRPMRAISKESAGLSKGLRKSRDELAGLNALQERIAGFRKLRNDADASRQALAAATQRVKAMREEIAKVSDPSKRMTAALERAERAVQKQRNAHVSNLGALRRSREALTAAGVSVNKLADHERELASRIATTTSRVQTQTQKLRSLADAHRRVQAAQQAMSSAQETAGVVRGVGASAMVGGAAVMSGPLAAARAASDFEQAMLGVARQVEGARDANGRLTPTYHAIAAEVMTLSQRLPMAANEIALLVAAGARMGIQGRENLMTFAETTAIAANAFELPADEIGENLARVAALYKIPIRNIGQLGDAINWLDDNAQSKGGEIIDVLQRIGDVADRLDYKKAAAFGSTFLSLGAAPEIAASATKALVRELSIAAVQPKRFQIALREIGFEAEDIQRRMTTDAAGTITAVLERINAAAPEARVSLATRIFGKEFGDDATKLALNLGELQRQIALTEDPKSRGSMGRENEARLATQAAQWALLKHQMTNTAVLLGATLAPTLINLMQITGGVLTKVQTWVQENPKLAEGIMKFALAGGAALTIAGALAIGVSAVIGPFAAARYAVTALSVRFGPLMRTIAPLARNALPMLMHGLRMLIPIAGGITAPLWAVIGAVAAIGLVVYKYWGPIKAFLGGVFDGLRESLGPIAGEFVAALSPLRPVSDSITGAVKQLWTWVSALLTPYRATSGELAKATDNGRMFGSFIGSVLTPVLRSAVLVVYKLSRVIRAVWAFSPISILQNNWTKITTFFSELPAKFTQIGANIIDGLRAGIEARFGPLMRVAQSVANLLTGTTERKLEVRSPSRVFARIGRYTAEGLAVGIADGANLPVRAMDRLQGRVVAAGAAVGRRPAAAAAGAGVRPGGAAAGQGGGDHYTIHIHGVAGDTESIKRAVREGIAEAERARQTRGRSRLTDRGD